MTARLRPIRIATVALSLVVGLASVSGVAQAHESKSAAPLLALHATRGDQPQVLDAHGRQVILRGVNVNSLGDYYQGNPKLPPVVPVTDADWARMQSHGFNVVRLLISWSALEPRRGHINRAYLRRIHRAVDEARDHGIATVIDMHQDAWGKYIASPKGTVCTDGRSPAIGWDGAPKWATITDDADTCTGGSREDSAAVLTAWDSFYADRDGIMSHLVHDWGVIARSFADDTSVAGYDLINEPNHGRGDVFTTALARYYTRAIAAIRGAEHGRRAVSHMVLFETTVYGVPVAEDFSNDPNLLFAPHHYGESIGNIPIDGLFEYYRGLAAKFHRPLWIGEYGWFSDPPVAQERLGRYSAKEDALITAGDAWWQWRQACGDPHSIGHPGGKPDSVLIHFQRNGCPGDHNLGVVPQWACTWRPYPRAAPGRLTSLASSCTDSLSLAGTTPRREALDVWFPGSVRPVVTGTNLAHIERRRVKGGWSITARVQHHYTLRASTV